MRAATISDRHVGLESQRPTLRRRWFADRVTSDFRLRVQKQSAPPNPQPVMALALKIGTVEDWKW